MKKILILIIFCFYLNNINAQNFSDCQVDFFLLESQEKLSSYDYGKEYVMRINNLPDYELKDRSNKNKKELRDELNEKLRDNADYNRDNLKVKDSLIEYYSEQLHKAGINIIWWEKLRNANENEIKEYKKRQKAYYKNPSSTQLNIVQGISIPIKKTEQKSDVAPEFINDSIQIVNIILYKRKQKIIRDDLPIFCIQGKDGVLKPVYDEERDYILPVGMTPVFVFSSYSNSTFILKNIASNIFGNENQIDFIVNEEKVSLYNYKFKINQNKDNQSIKDISIDLFYDKKKLAKIDEFLTGLKSKKLVVQSDGEEFINPLISSFKFDYNSLDISFSINGKIYSKRFEGIKDPNFRYNNSDQEQIEKTVFDLPIYYSDCYIKSSSQFNNLKLRSDFINNPDLKKKLEDAVSSSSQWLNYEIVGVILTNKSQWTILTNKYTGLKESRFLFADVYFRNTMNDKCYYQEDVYFTQKADVMQGFVYSMFVSSPQSFQPYPCNLK
jgi:hypothetical protein